MDDFRPRPTQLEILAYSGGRMGISAVPGAGKTVTLAALAAQLVRTAIGDGQEVLVVTLVNSAVENVRARIGSFVGREGLLASVGYRVRTLHGLANDIVHEHPGLVGLADDFRIIDEREAQRALEEAVDVWVRSNPGAGEPFLEPSLNEGQRQWAESTQWPEALLSLAGAYVRRAKDWSLSPEVLQVRLSERADGGMLALARAASEIYALYQRALHLRGVVDFDDLIRLALQALEQDQDLLTRLRARWPYILEDEAQDSSRLQEKILRLLAGRGGNWVRVGDPNQAINTTFTTADPRLLRAFLEEEGVTSLPLHHSGRSQQCILDLANYLVRWTMDAHPERAVRTALSAPPYIEPTPPGDPQPNPATNSSVVHVVPERYSPEREIEVVVGSVARWLDEHPQGQAAILVPRNQRGFEVTDALRRAGVPYIELLRSTTSTRKTAGALGNILQYLADPSSASGLARVFEVWRREDREDAGRALRMRRLAAAIRRCGHVETFLWPRAGQDWLAELAGLEDTQPLPTGAGEPGGSVDDGLSGEADAALLAAFRDLVRRWQGATVLPIDQLVLTIAQDLFREAGDLALSHKLAIMLRAASDNNPDWRLPELTQELAVIAKNQRRFLGFAEEDEGITAEDGKVTVSTLHKAKGLEWDRVYVMSVNNYNFPSAEPYDEYIAERWFVRDRLNLEAEALGQLRALRDGADYAEGPATREARLEYVAERLRLLYVGITRARRELVMTWNTGRSREAKQMAVPFIALRTWWASERDTYDGGSAPPHGGPT
ncbi:MAG: ATP-dependent helicase [Anaerolineae bacterium]|nr:ATP-dependent helicase [Anaerolineae bacterium]